MAKNEEDAPQGINDTGRSYAKYTGIIFQMIATIAVFAFIGHYLDTRFKTATPWITAMCCLTGVCLSIFQIIRQLK